LYRSSGTGKIIPSWIPKPEIIKKKEMRMDGIIITQSDLEKLRHLLAGRLTATSEDRDNLIKLEEELDRAEIIDKDVDPPRNVVTMNSEVRLKDLDTNEEKVYTLVFPGQRIPGTESISILAPIGMALLGYRVGNVINWRVPRGMRRLKILKVTPRTVSARAQAV
jgi:regulator of nucleoside diphosphate kinase